MREKVFSTTKHFAEVLTIEKVSLREESITKVTLRLASSLGLKVSLEDFTCTRFGDSLCRDCREKSRSCLIVKDFPKKDGKHYLVIALPKIYLLKNEKEPFFGYKYEFSHETELVKNIKDEIVLAVLIHEFLKQILKETVEDKRIIDSSDVEELIKLFASLLRIRNLKIIEEMKRVLVDEGVWDKITEEVIVAVL